MAVRIGTSEHGGTFYTQGLAFAELFNRGKSGEPCVVQTSDASIHNAEQLDRGELEFGFMASNWIGRAKNATPPFTKPIARAHGCAGECGTDVFRQARKLADSIGGRLQGQTNRHRHQRQRHGAAYPYDLRRLGHFLRQLHGGAYGLRGGR